MIILTLIMYVLFVLVAIGLNLYYWRVGKNKDKSYLWNPLVWWNFTAIVWLPVQGYKLIRGLL